MPIFMAKRVTLSAAVDRTYRSSLSQRTLCLIEWCLVAALETNSRNILFLGSFAISLWTLSQSLHTPPLLSRVINVAFRAS